MGTSIIWFIEKDLLNDYSQLSLLTVVISLQIFNNVMETPDRVHVTKSMV